MTAYPLESTPWRLAECEEARDLLLQVFLKDGHCTAVFKFGAVALPPELEPRLLKMVGKGCAVLRLDGYHIREVPDLA